MLGQDLLAVHRQDEHDELIGSPGRAIEHGQPIVRADRELIGQCDDLLAGILLLRLARIGAELCGKLGDDGMR
jgi:hypothetical protein